MSDICLQIVVIYATKRWRQVGKGLFTWRWGIPGRWGNPPNRGRKIKRVYMQSYNPGVLGWGFLRLLLRLQLGSLPRGVPSSHLEKDGKLILAHKCICSWKRHTLYYAVFGFARNRWLNTLTEYFGNAKYFEMWTFYTPCVSVTVSDDFCHETARVCTKF